MIMKGRLAEVGTPREIGGRQRALATVTFSVTPALAQEPLPETIEATVSDGVAKIATANPSRVVVALSRWAEARGEPELPGLSVTRPSLEDMYLQMVAASDAEEGNAR
jgi:ABC-2 type transport system ATP-binding protein